MSATVTESEVATILDAVRATMAAEPYCFLITADPNGNVHARLVAAIPTGEDIRVWIPTHPATRKVAEIRAGSRATLAFYDRSGGGGFAVLEGQTRIDGNPEAKRRHWLPELVEYFPDGPDSDDYLVLEVTPTRIEILSFGHGIATRPYAWKPAVLVRDTDGWQPSSP